MATEYIDQVAALLTVTGCGVHDHSLYADH